jgi:Zn-dependent protease with chaperone function
MISSIMSAINHKAGAIAFVYNKVCNAAVDKIFTFFNIESRIEKIHRLKDRHPELYNKIRRTEIGGVDINDLFITLSHRKGTELHPDVILTPELFSLGHGAFTNGSFVFIEQEFVEECKSKAFIKYVLAHEWAHIFLQHHLQKFNIPLTNKLQNIHFNNMVNLLSTYIIPNVTVYYLMQQLRDLIVAEHFYCDNLIELPIYGLWCNSVNYITNNPILLLGTSLVFPLLGRYMLAKLSSQYSVFMENEADKIALDNLTNEELAECRTYLLQHNQHTTSFREEFDLYFLPTHPSDEERMKQIDQVLLERSKRTL